MTLSLPYHIICGILEVIIHLVFRLQNIDRNSVCAGKGKGILHIWIRGICICHSVEEEESLVIHTTHKHMLFSGCMMLILFKC